jgi:hypothetical protein
MYNYPEPDELLTELRRERSIRRTVTVLETKRKRIREELQQLVQHITLLVPATERFSHDSHHSLLEDAISRLGDDAFAELLLQIVQDVH